MPVIVSKIAQVAFGAELSDLHGSYTVWYYTCDLDEFADTILGTINMSVSGDTNDSTSLHVFNEAHE